MNLSNNTSHSGLPTDATGTAPQRQQPEQNLPTLADVRQAAQILAPLVHQTPVFTSSRLNQRFGCELFFKAEHLQKTGAFKYRGANFAVSQLSNNVKGVVTHSSGNHGAALAAAASARGLKAHVVMPENSVASKITAVKAYGAEVHLCAPNQASREAGMAALVAQGMTPIHPYDDNAIIAGQGTAALEFLTHQAEVDILIVPVGGGGLLSGTLLAAQSLSQPPLVLGAEPAGADDAYRSLQQRHRVEDHHPQTIADGLRARIGVRNFALINHYCDGIIRVEEAAIIEAMRLVWHYLKQVIEPSAATVLAAIAAQPERFSDRRVGLILSGGNVDLDNLPF